MSSSFGLFVWAHKRTFSGRIADRAPFACSMPISILRPFAMPSMLFENQSSIFLAQKSVWTFHSAFQSSNIFGDSPRSHPSSAFLASGGGPPFPDYPILRHLFSSYSQFISGRFGNKSAFFFGSKRGEQPQDCKLTVKTLFEGQVHSGLLASANGSQCRAGIDFSLVHYRSAFATVCFAG